MIYTDDDALACPLLRSCCCCSARVLCITSQPITVLRNALGKAEGGSGVPLDREKYMESVEYWKKHAVIVAPPKPRSS